MEKVKMSGANASKDRHAFVPQRNVSLCLILFFALRINFVTLNANAQEDFSSAYKLYNQAIESNNNVDAIKYAQIALKMGSAKFGEQSANTTNLQYNLALAYIVDKQALPAFELLEEIKQDYRRLFGELSEEHFGAVLEQLDTAKLDAYPTNKKRKRALKPLVSYAEDLVEEIAESQPERAPFAYYDFARIMNAAPLNQYFFNKGFKTNRIAESLLLAKFGENDLRTLEIRFMIAKFLLAKDKKNDAIEYYEKVIATVTSASDTSHPFELASHAALVQLYEKKGKSEAATEHCLAIGRMKPWTDEIEPLPLYRLNPMYPEKMARDGEEGFVNLEFAISSFGFVQDIKVLQSSNPEFDKASLDALAKWRYAPKVVESKAVVSQKLQVRLDYTLR
jgi:TonB family protein